MKRTYVTILPNHVGACLKASRIFSNLGVNLTRLSYNKAIDSHCLFIDAEGPEELLDLAEIKLKNIGYLENPYKEKNVVLMEFRLQDTPGRMTSILELIEEYKLNISYMSTQEEDSEYRFLKIGFITEDLQMMERFREEASRFCRIRTMDYNHADHTYDNSIFYSNFVSELVAIMDLKDSSQKTLLINVNQAMQELDEVGTSPYKTFDNIKGFAERIARARGEHFNPRISRHSITKDTEIILIEPPCGSNTTIIKSKGEYLFVDTGYACYQQEMYELFREMIPEFEEMKKIAFITHADLDHCGLLYKFDKVYASKKSAECLRLEYEGEPGFREMIRLHKPYISICKELSMYRPTPPELMEIVGEERKGTDLIAPIGFFSFGELNFELFEGQGGHLPGETLMVDFEHQIVFSGDIFINIKDMIPEQASYNRYAPMLMTSVDTDADLCRAERNKLLEMLTGGNWKVFCGHGAMKEFKVEASK